MLIYFIKFICLFLGFTVITKTYYDYKKGSEGTTMLLFWTIAWLAVIYSAIDPGRVYRLAQHFSSSNVGVGTFVGVAFVFLFFLTYRVYVKANRLEKKLRDMVIKLGLNGMEKK